MRSAIIHVNRHFIAANAKDGGERPIYSVKRGRKTEYAQRVKVIGGEVELIDPRVTAPLPCGARAWLKVTGGEIELYESVQFEVARNRCNVA